MLIEICGGIASGKTTLCKSIAALCGSAVHEDFQKNPFLDFFYKEQKRFSFETEVTFLLQHYHSIKIASKSCPTICDFSLVQDLAYADTNLIGARHKIFCSIEIELRAEIGLPDLLIYLTCPSSVLLERVLSRNRDVEKGITIEYLNALNSALEHRVKKIKKTTNIVVIDSHSIDFREMMPQIPELEKILQVHLKV